MQLKVSRENLESFIIVLFKKIYYFFFIRLDKYFLTDDQLYLNLSKYGKNLKTLTV